MENYGVQMVSDRHLRVSLGSLGSKDPSGEAL